MNLKQCPGCESMVDAQKAFCPDCGTSLEDEQKRSRASDFDNLAKTQNLSKTQHKELLEKLNLSFIFASQDKPQQTDEKNNEPEIESLKQQPEPIVAAKSSEPRVSSAAVKVPPQAPVKMPAVVKNVGEAGKRTDGQKYILMGTAVLAFLLLLLIALAIAILRYIYY